MPPRAGSAAAVARASQSVPGRAKAAERGTRRGGSIPGSRTGIVRKGDKSLRKKELARRASEGRVQDNADFRQLPREFQKVVERGGSLEDVVADAKSRKLFGVEDSGGGAPPSRGGGGGGGGGRGGGGAVTDTGFDIGASQTKGLDVDSVVKKWFTGILDGTIGSFTDEKEALLTAELVEAGNRKKTQLQARERTRGISRGLFRSGLQLQAEREIDIGIEQEKSAGIRQVKMARIQAEFTDKMGALGMAQQWLDSRRRYELGKEQIQASREATRAQISLGYAQIAAGKENARLSAGRAGAALGLQREQFEFSKQMALENQSDRRMMNLFGKIDNAFVEFSRF